MKKKSVIFLIVLLVCVSLASAYHYVGSISDRPAYQYPYFDPRSEFTENLETALELPDLVISNIFVPDELPKNTVLEELWFEVKNIGEGKASGQIMVEVEIDQPNMPKCKRRLFASGGTSSSDAKLSSRYLRYTNLLPGQTIKFPFTTPSIARTYIPPYCQLQLQNDLIIRAEVNPVGSSTGNGNLNPRGRLSESDRSNNYVEKIVRIVDNPSKIVTSIKLVPGLNAVSIPVETNTRAYEFIQKSGCELYYLPEPQNYFKIRDRTLELSQIQLVPRNKVLESRTAYFAACNFHTTIDIFGSNPEPYNMELKGNNFAFLPTRIEMGGKRILDFIKGCGGTYGGDIRTEFFSYVPGTRNSAGKMISESVPSHSKIIPGIFYYGVCGGTFNGVWDPEDSTYAPRERLLLRKLRPTPVRQKWFGRIGQGSSYRYGSRLGARTRQYTYPYLGRYYQYYQN